MPYKQDNSDSNNMRVLDPDGNVVGPRFPMAGPYWKAVVDMVQDAYERGKREGAAPAAVSAGRFNVGDVINFGPNSFEWEITKVTGAERGDMKAVGLGDTGRSKLPDLLHANYNLENAKVVRSAAPHMPSPVVTNPGWSA